MFCWSNVAFYSGQVLIRCLFSVKFKSTEYCSKSLQDIFLTNMRALVLWKMFWGSTRTSRMSRCCTLGIPLAGRPLKGQQYSRFLNTASDCGLLETQFLGNGFAIFSRLTDFTHFASQLFLNLLGSWHKIEQAWVKPADFGFLIMWIITFSYYLTKVENLFFHTGHVALRGNNYF